MVLDDVIGAGPQVVHGLCVEEELGAILGSVHHPATACGHPLPLTLLGLYCRHEHKLVKANFI